MNQNNYLVTFNTQKEGTKQGFGKWVWTMKKFQSRISNEQLEANEQLVIPK